MLGASFRLGQIDARQDHAELVAAQASQEAKGEAGFHHVREVLQQRIAGRVATGVVDQLELVEVDVENDDRALVVAHALKLGLQFLLEGAPIVQARQGIVRGRESQFLRHDVLHGRIADTGPITEAGTIRTEDGLPSHGHPRMPAVLGNDAKLEILAGMAGQRLALLPPHQVAVGRVHQRQRKLVQYHAFAHRVSGQAFDGRIDPAQVAIGSVPVLPGIGVIGDGAKALLAFGHLADPFLDCGGHRVEAAANRRYLVVSMERHAHIEIPGSNALTGIRKCGEVTSQPVTGGQ